MRWARTIIPSWIPLVSFLVLASGCSGSDPEQLSAQQAYFDFFGLTFGDTRDSALDQLGSYVDDPSTVETAETLLFFDGGVEIRFDSLDRIEMIGVQAPGALNHIDSLRALEPKLDLLGATAEQVVTRLGGASDDLDYTYVDDNGPNGERRVGRLTNFCIALVSDECVIMVILNQWIYGQ